MDTAETFVALAGVCAALAVLHALFSDSANVLDLGLDALALLFSYFLWWATAVLLVIAIGFESGVLT